MKIFVDKLPEKESECPFAIQSTGDYINHRNDFPWNCQLMMSNGYDWTNMSHSGNQNHPNCRLHHGEHCLFLRELKFY